MATPEAQQPKEIGDIPVLPDDQGDDFDTASWQAFDGEAMMTPSESSSTTTKRNEEQQVHRLLKVLAKKGIQIDLKELAEEEGLPVANYHEVFQSAAQREADGKSWCQVLSLMLRTLTVA